MKLILLFAVFCFAGLVHAEDDMDVQESQQTPAAEARDPAATNAQPVVVKKVYPGSADEDDLQVQSRLPDAGLRIDARSVQREVFKSLYNQDLKDDNRESVEE